MTADFILAPKACPECGIMYGHHPGCPSDENRAQRDSQDREMGRALIEAIQNDDAVQVGRLIRGEDP